MKFMFICFFTLFSFVKVFSSEVEKDGRETKFFNIIHETEAQVRANCTKEPKITENFTIEPRIETKAIEPSEEINFTIEPREINNFVIEPKSIANFTIEPKKIDNFTIEPREYSNFTIDPREIGNFTIEPRFVGNFTIEPREIGNFTIEPRIIDNFTIEPREMGNFIIEPRVIDNFTIEPRVIDNFTIEPKEMGNFIIEPRVIGNFTIEPMKIGNFTIEPRVIGNFTIEPREMGNFSIEPRFIGNFTIEPKEIDNFTIEPRKIDNFIIEPKEVSNFTIDPRKILNFRKESNNLIEPKVFRKRAGIISKRAIIKQRIADPEIFVIQPKKTCECGIKTVSRIVGGNHATKYEYPWIGALCEGDICDNDHQFCGLALINDRYGITAAHCVQGMIASQLSVNLGDYNLASETETKAVTLKVEKIIKHGNYNAVSLHNDIALLKLSESVKFNDHIMPICLPSPEVQYANEMATVAGWGTTTSGGSAPTTLKEVNVKVISNAVCQTEYSKGEIIDSMLCAGSEGKDSCQGDSGGPLIKKVGSKWELIGIVSWGSGCGGQYPGVYTRVRSFMNWIIPRITEDATCT